MPGTTDHSDLMDRLACKTLMETYSYAEIVRDPDLFASVFAEDARFGTHRGRDNIRQAAVEFLASMVGITELRISPAGWHVTVNGDEASGQFFTVAQLKVPQQDGTVKVLHIDAGWNAQFIRYAEGWLISDLGGIKDPNLLHDSDIMVTLTGDAEVKFDY